MNSKINALKFASLFKKYRLRSEIETLAQFGDLLSEEGLTYETSLFTRWQKGDRIPGDRRTLLGIIIVFSKRMGITIDAANRLLEAAGQGYLTETEKEQMPKLVVDYSFSAPFSSVGELLKNHRLRRDLTPEELSLSVGWENTHNLTLIESGELEKPPREIVDKLCEVLKLEEQEKNALLLAGNYMPTREEIVAIQKRILPEIEKWPYSAVVYDFCWRIICINQKHQQLLCISDEDTEAIKNDLPVALKIVFDPNFMQNKNLIGEDQDIWHYNLIRFIMHFRSLQKSITKDKWYRETINDLMKNDLFRKLWLKAESKQVDMIVTRYGRKVFVHPKDHIRLTYNIFVVPLLHDPRFEIEYYSPADLSTATYLAKESR